MRELNAANAELAGLRAQLSEAARQREADRERAAMLRGELQHRVRNVLALVRSIFQRSAASSATMDDLAAHFEGRIGVLARYQLAPSLGSKGAADLEMMVHDALHDYGAGADPRVTVGGPEVRVRHDAAQMVGLALHELVTNSIKFGLLSTPGNNGAIAIDWTLDGDRLAFAWVETGISLVGVAPRKSGFGHGFILQALPYQLGAAADIALGPGKLVCTIALPLSADVAPGHVGGGDLL